MKTISDFQLDSGLTTSPGTDTAIIAKRFDTIRIRIAKIKRKHEKYQEYKRKKKLAIQKEEERRIRGHLMRQGSSKICQKLTKLR